jgi:hypothetical protein
MTHVWDPGTEAEFLKFCSLDYAGSPDVWLLLDARTPGLAAIRKRFDRCHVFVEDELFSRLPCTRLRGEQLYHNVHVPVLDFWLSHREYEYYWVIEFDVRYTGAWGAFFRSFEGADHDLITSHVRHFWEEPGWCWWDSLHHPAETIGRSHYLRSFNVIYRISNRALALVHDAQRDGWSGHPEVLLPTLLHHGGYRIRDFGGCGDFVGPGDQDRFYTSGSNADGEPSPFCSMRWRPSRVRAGLFRNRLYHPVKPVPVMEPLPERIWFFLHWIGNRLAGHWHRLTRRDRPD